MKSTEHPLQLKFHDELRLGRFRKLDLNTNNSCTVRKRLPSKKISSLAALGKRDHRNEILLSESR